MNLHTLPPWSRRMWCRLGAAALPGTMLALLAGLSPAGAASADAVAALPSNCTQAGSSWACTFSYTGAAQNFTVPAGESSITITADGAQGGTGSLSAGGHGGEAQADFTVTPGDVIEVVVGGQGVPYYGDAKGGFNGGGPGGSGAQGKVNTGVSGGGGGGASDVRFGACASTLSCGLADRVLVAGGGGGSVWGSSSYPGQGGGGGFPVGLPGASYHGGDGGGGGSQAAGGDGGAGDRNDACGGHPATDGRPGGAPTRDAGGAGGSGGTIYYGTESSNGGNGGGGGGGGYWAGGGGGGGCGYSDFSGAGGGGSSYGPADATLTNDTWTGNGRVVISHQTPPDAPTIGHAVPGDAAARVTFTPPANTGGTPVTSYTATATDQTHPDQGGQTATGPGSPLTVTGLNNGDQYTFKVTATNRIGTSPASAASSPVTPNPLVYVSNKLPPTSSAKSLVTAWAQGVTGNAEPFSALSLPYSPAGIALDQAGQLWVASPGNNSLAEYAKGATGSAPPIRTISGGDTGLNFPQGLTLDPAGNLFVANKNSVTEYAAGAEGNALPVIKIQGTGTNLNASMGVAVDGSGDVWVANSGNSTVTEYAQGATGEVPPIATITSGVKAPYGLAVGPDGNLWVANYVGGSAGVGSVTEYAKGAVTGAKPITTITNGLGLPAGVALNQAADLFVANYSLGAAGAVTEYAKGSTTVTANIMGPATTTGLNEPFGIAVGGAAPGHEHAPLRITHIAAGAGQHRHAVAGVTFTDTDPAARLSQFSGTIAWGDGTTTAIPHRNFFKRPGGKFAAGGGHTYAQPGTYTITITIRDTDGAKAKASTTLKVTGR